MIDTEKRLRSDASANSKTRKPRSTNLIWTKKALLARLRRGPEARRKFVESQISNGIAFQIRALRSQKPWNQSELAEKVGTTQNQIHRLEKASLAKPTISTLKKIAAAFDVALVVRFVPFSQLVDWVSGTPFQDRGLSTQSLAVPSFGQEDHDQTVPGTITICNAQHNINVAAQIQTSGVISNIGPASKQHPGPKQPSAASELRSPAA